MKRILLINILTTILLSIGMGIGGWLLGTTHAQESSSVILACVDNLTGSVRIVESQSECKPSETGTQWNAQGEQGSAVLSGYELISEGFDVVPTNLGSDSDATIFVTCPDGKLPVGGGFSARSENDRVEIISSYPYDNSWYVVVNTNVPMRVGVHAVCAYVEN